MATITSLPSTRNTWRIGTQRNYDGDGKKKAIGIFSKTTTLHDHAVLYSSLPSLPIMNCKCQVKGKFGQVVQIHVSRSP